MRLLTLSLAASSCITCSRGQQQQSTLLEKVEHVKPLSVAIIGAGAGGASTAHHLSKFAAAADVPINITIFERNDTAGGRSTTVNAYDDHNLPLELGASIFVKVNHILNDAVKEFNLSTDAFMPEIEVPGAGLGVWDGQDFVLEMSEGWWDTAKLLWKYGLAPVKTIRLMKKVVGKFLQMYEEPIFPFDSLTQTAQDLGLLEVTSATGEQYLSDNGIPGPFGRHVVQASTRVNYAQNLRYIHGLEAMVCMAAEGGMAVQGGNWQIFEHMIEASKATTMFDTEVNAVEKRKDGGYTLRSAAMDPELSGYARAEHNYDTVILAAPIQFSNVEFSPTLRTTPDKIPYVKLHVTLFTSPYLLSPAFFNLPKGKVIPRAILTTIPEDERPREGSDGVGSTGFFSISLLQPITNPETGGQEYAYKIFSAEPPNSMFFASLLDLETPSEVDRLADCNLACGIDKKDVSWIYRKVWHSYPYEFPRVTFEEIELDDDLWYTSGIESFISTMETSALMGKNVARLVVDKRLRELEEVRYAGFMHGEVG